MALSQEQKDFYCENGYLRIGALLDAGEIAQLRSEYDRIIAEARDDNSFRNLSGGDANSTDDNTPPAQVLQIMQMCERSIHFRRLLYDSRLLDTVQEFIGPNIMMFHDQGLFKPAYTGGAVFWHQDNAYWRCSPANLISCWLTLDDVTRDNGAMQVIPGSHLKPIWHDTSEASAALLDLGKTVDADRAVVVDLPAGGCMFHHCQTMHYTAPNITDRQRRAWAIHFMPLGTTDGEGQALHVDFHRPLLRMRA